MSPLIMKFCYTVIISGFIRCKCFQTSNEKSNRIIRNLEMGVTKMGVAKIFSFIFTFCRNLCFL